ncbi:DUF262 domain-containing protein [Mucilaginibacter terrae]|uniref:Uncharacterized protein with ParB-like and HNH nuclease domain n=1 Tax=Mucilaginibacter terrae TaxID=1955052 RepID=A0ABU3GMQ0_9SPHI|nr:DUF262 domain-containing protein [Mucilaginibacter terrae]MDT3401064.1 uncharacterized protein with ParB-like and HNH nuclease domain [Mucilaginibacter terrae]
MNPDNLKKQIEEQRNLLNTDRLDLSFGEIISLYERKELIIKPAFQRYFRWHEEQRSRFIESILLGIPIPPIFVAEDGDGVWELVDGLQRVSTVLSFFGLLNTTDEGIRKKNNWVLTSGDRVETLEGFDYLTLPIALQRNIKRATCRVEILRWNSSYDMRFELFNRLNTGGSPLTPQEIRNCIYRDISSKFNDFLKELANEKIFKDLISLDYEQYEQLYNEELALRFISLFNNSGNIRISIAHHMTEFMKSALENNEFDYRRYRNVFMEVFSLLSPLKNKIFRQRDGRFATSLYDVITLGVAENLAFYKTQSPEVILSKIDNEVRQDAVLLKFSRKGGNNQITRIQNRIKEAKRIFSNE